jgi:hypothetical protein
MNVGRWHSPDPLGGDITNPQSLNRYAYVMNNPTTLIDPLGLDCGGVNGPPCHPVNEPGRNNPFAAAGWDPLNLMDIPVGPGLFGVPGLVGFDVTLVGYLPGTDLGIYDIEAIFDLGFILPLDLTGNGNISGGGGAANNRPVVLKNPCQYQGRALPPAAYATLGQQAKASTANFLLDVGMGWPKGEYLDAQPLASGTIWQNAAYGNYVYGVYMASAGVPLNRALSGANTYAFFRSHYPAGTPMDPDYRSLPAANVANITNGYSAQVNGTVCHN